MIEDFVYKHKKAILVSGVLCIALIVIVSVVFKVIDGMNSAIIDVLVTPSIAKVKIGDRFFDPVGQYKVEPGEYDVSVSAEGFETKATKLTAVADSTVRLEIYLEPEEENNDWYEEHAGDGLILGEILNNEALEALAKLKDENPILNELPIEIDYYTNNYTRRIKYTISYLMNEDNTGFVITIKDYSGGNREDAISRLKNRGANVDKYEIEYIDMTSDWKNGRAE